MFHVKRGPMSACNKTSSVGDKVEIPATKLTFSPGVVDAFHVKRCRDIQLGSWDLAQENPSFRKKGQYLSEESFGRIDGTRRDKVGLTNWNGIGEAPMND